jgi:hypothetical protein
MSVPPSGDEYYDFLPPSDRVSDVFHLEDDLEDPPVVSHVTVATPSSTAKKTRFQTPDRSLFLSTNKPSKMSSNVTVNGAVIK